MKKCIAFVLSLVMVLTLFTACGGDSGKNESATTGKNAQTQTGGETQGDEGKGVAAGDMVTVNLVLPAIFTFNDADVQEVNTEINKILAEKYGVQVKLTYVNSGSWVQQTNLMLTTDEADVMCLWQTPLTTFVNNGQIIPLDDYMANASDAMKAVWTDVELNGTRVNGTLYSITNLRNFANDFSVQMSEEIVNELGIDITKITDLDSLGDVLRQVKEARPDVYPIAGAQALITQWSWDGLGDEKFIGVLDNYGQSETVINLFESKDFRNFVDHAYEWYQEGLVMQDILSNTESGEQLCLNGKAFAYFNNASNAAPPAGIVRAVLLDRWAVGNSYAALSYGISSNSKHPDEAWKLMEAIYTDKDISTFLIDGIEGKHYVVNEDGTIDYPQGLDVTSVPYGGAQQYWAFPNGGLTYPLAKNGATFFTDLVEFNRSAISSKATGFSFDSTEVVDEYSACINVMDKYYKALMAGTLEPETAIAEATDELMAAGLQDIIDAKQAQLDKFLGK